jgi:asparagine synthase (glutamine-hydrolysing)
MSIILGIRGPFEHRVEQAELLRLASVTERYAPDGTFVHSSAGLGLCFQAYHTHQRSRLESQPTSDRFGNVIVLDGRIDNHIELKNELGIKDSDVSDSLIVLQAFKRWDLECFAHLTGDWALALWSATDRVLYLARDHAGTRTLYFQNVGSTIRFATHLETFFAHGEKYKLDEEFAASFLCGRPVRDLTPYLGICAVPPGHYLAFSKNGVTKGVHWNWLEGDLIRYQSDAEYEEHFIALFKQSVERRTGPGAPILAELSGGMDSTSIVCMSDHIRRSQGADLLGLLETVSYYDPSEPSWDEEPYFSITETRRGKVGIHLRASMLNSTFEPNDSFQAQYLLPGTDSAAVKQEEIMLESFAGREFRVILSGHGGDEVVGGIPTPMPELADLLHSMKLLRFLQQAAKWAIVQRMPVTHTMWDAIRFLHRSYFPHSIPEFRLPSWIDERLRHILASVAERDALKETPFRARPSQVSHQRVSWSVIEALPHRSPGFLTRYEYRYPYLDRDLLRFLSQVPCEQLLRPGRRRSLMRRALAAIVPHEILEKKQKAYLCRTPLIALWNARSSLMSFFSDPITAQLGLISHPIFMQSLELVTSGKDVQDWPAVMRTILFEIWLRSGVHLQQLREQDRLPAVNPALSCRTRSVPSRS